MATNIENLKSQMRKGMLEFCVLLLLSKGDSYVSEIIARMKSAHLIVVEGTLYPLLTRLKNDGLLSYRWEESPSGPPRKYYSITPIGVSFLDELHASWNEISQTVKHLMQEETIAEAITEEGVIATEDETITIIETSLTGDDAAPINSESTINE